MKNKVFNKNFIYSHWDGELTLQQIIDKAKENGIEEKNYGKVIVKLDYSNCYYEGDYPNLKITKDN